MPTKSVSVDSGFTRTSPLGHTWAVPMNQVSALIENIFSFFFYNDAMIYLYLYWCYDVELCGPIISFIFVGTIC